MSEFDLPKKEIAKRLTMQQKLDMVGDPHGLSPQVANKITQARLQNALSQLAEMNVDRVHEWLGEVGARAPAEAVRLYLELLEFRMPRMKAAQVIATFNTGTDGKREMKDMSIEELESIVANQ